MNDDELKEVWSYFQPGPLSEILTITNLQHAVNLGHILPYTALSLTHSPKLQLFCFHAYDQLHFSWI